MTGRGHVEFVGPPGAGKSTLHRRLTSNPRFYGELYDDAIERLCRREHERSARLLYGLPPSLSSPLETALIQEPIRRRMFAAFVEEHPSFPTVVDAARRAVDGDPEQVESLLTYAAERYRLGVETVDPDERLCLDEGFAMAAVSVLWRTGRAEFSLPTFFEAIPTPDVLVYATAPTEICLRRQRERDDVVSNGQDCADVEVAQRHHEAACSRVVEAIDRTTSATVVAVETTDPVDAVVAKLERALG